MVGTAAYVIAQLHVVVVGYLSVSVDNNLYRINQREQRRAECFPTDNLLLVADTCFCYCFCYNRKYSS